jgi:hypothetical protein
MVHADDIAMAMALGHMPVRLRAFPAFVLMLVMLVMCDAAGARARAQAAPDQ